MIVSENLGSELDEFLSGNLPQVRLVRAKQRQGLIRARIIGADSATGEVHPAHSLALFCIFFNFNFINYFFFIVIFIYYPRCKFDFKMRFWLEATNNYCCVPFDTSF